MYRTLRIFGCDAYMLMLDAFREKWDSKAEKLIFVGYQESENFKHFNPETGRVHVSKNVIFNATERVNVKEKNLSISVNDDLPEINENPQCNSNHPQADAHPLLMEHPDDNITRGSISPGTN